MSLSVLEPPGAWGADIAVGEAQPIGLPPNFGGPYAGFFAARREHIRRMPGRIVGRTTDHEGNGGYVLTRPPAEISVGQVLRAVDGPLAGVRRVRPEDTVYEGTAAHLQQLWVALRAAVRGVLDEVSLADLVRGRLPARIRRLAATPDAWQPR